MISMFGKVIFAGAVVFDCMVAVTLFSHFDQRLLDWHWAMRYALIGPLVLSLLADLIEADYRRAHKLFGKEKAPAS